MNKTGLFIALAVGLFAAVLFAVFPQLDVTLARMFYDEATRRFALGPVGAAEFVRRAAMWIAWAFAAPAIVAPILKLIWPQKPLIIPGRAVLFLLITMFLTAIVLPNVIFKQYWGRPRPITTVEFHGSQVFRPWWDPRGNSAHSGSFFSGEAATAFATYAPAALAPASLRPAAFVAATLFGLTTGALRMAFGAHYASDIIAAGLATFLVTWFMHGLIYRWNGMRLTDERIDQSLTNHIVRFSRSGLLGPLITIVAAVTIARLIALKLSIVDLFPDEARYWAWAQAPAFGYFSKPPLIAWIIAVAGRICGDSEFCVRAAAPLFYAGTALISYLIARHLYNERIAFWTGLATALATGAVFSARIMSTDVPLLFFWALALLAYVKMLDRPTTAWALVLGLAIGLGLLAKYAMIYFLVSVAAVSGVDPRARALWRGAAIWLALVVALIVIAPNLMWNAAHDWATFRSAEGNIVGSGLHFDPLGALGFVASQFAVCGPIVLAVFLIAVLRPSKRRKPDARDRITSESSAPADRVMFWFALPPLLLVTIVALFSSAKANWAAPAVISMTVLAVALLVRCDRWGWLYVSLALGVVLQLTLLVGDARADQVSLGFLPQPDVYQRTMGWKALSVAVRQTARNNRVRTIAAEQNGVVASLLYYLRNDTCPIRAWSTSPMPANQFEFDRPLTSDAAEPVLFLSDRSAAERLAEYYSTVEPLPVIEVASGPHSVRRLFSFKLSGVRRRIEPLKR